jgi:hypothetical protein
MLNRLRLDAPRDPAVRVAAIEAATAAPPRCRKKPSTPSRPSWIAASLFTPGPICRPGVWSRCWKAPWPGRSASSWGARRRSAASLSRWNYSSGRWRWSWMAMRWSGGRRLSAGLVAMFLMGLSENCQKPPISDIHVWNVCLSFSP